MILNLITAKRNYTASKICLDGDLILDVSFSEGETEKYGDLRAYLNMSKFVAPERNCEQSHPQGK